MTSHTKKCSVCELEKPLTNFHKNGFMRYRSSCKPCENEKCASKRQERSNRGDHETADRCAELHPNGVKYCPDHQMDHNLSAFAENCNTEDGLQHYCKIAMRNRMRAHRQPIPITDE